MQTQHWLSPRASIGPATRPASGRAAHVRAVVVGLAARDLGAHVQVAAGAPGEVEHGVHQLRGLGVAAADAAGAPRGARGRAAAGLKDQGAGFRAMSVDEQIKAWDTAVPVSFELKYIIVC